MKPYRKLTDDSPIVVRGRKGWLTVDEETDELVAELEYHLAKEIGTAVCKAYPNRGWEVRVSMEARMVILLCPPLSMRKGYHLKMESRTLLQLCHAAVKAAGEILERYGVSRSPRASRDDERGLPREEARPEEADVADADTDYGVGHAA